MKKLLIAFSLFLIGLLGGVASAQLTTNVSVTVTDPTSQTWNNGSISYVFQPIAGFNGQYYWGNNPLPDSYRVLTTVQLNGGAQASFTLPRSTDITPSGTSWSYRVCAWATTPCVTVPIPTSGATQDISTLIDANLNPISAPVTTIPLAYQNSEIKTVVNAGGIYFNTSQKIPLYYDGTNWLPFTASPVTGAFLLNPVASQTVTMPTGVETLFVGTNAANEFVQNYTITSLNDAGSGQTQNVGNWSVYTDSGLGRNTGNPNGVNCGLSDCGWDDQKMYELDMTNYRQGISQGLGGTINKFSNGDFNGMYFYMNANGGNTDASGEGTTFGRLATSEERGYYIGTTTTTGNSQAPTLSSGAHFNSGSYLIDISQPVVFGTLAGTSSLWVDGSQTYLPSQPVANAVVPSTGICHTTTYIGASPAYLMTPITRSVTCTLSLGTITNGLAWQAAGALPEQVTISGVTSPSGGAQTFNVTGRNPAPTGSYFIQGGTHGFMSYVDDFNNAGIRTTFLVYGAPDISHVFFGFVDLGKTYGYRYPDTGRMAETNSSPYVIYPGAQIVSIDSNGAHPQLTPNDIPFTSGDRIENPHDMARSERIMSLGSNAVQMGNMAIAQEGLEVGIGNGNSETYTAGVYAAIRVSMSANRRWYNCTNPGCGREPSWLSGGGLAGWLAAPDNISVGNPAGTATFGTLLMADQPVNGNSVNNCTATILCINGDNINDYKIFAEQFDSVGRSITLQRNSGNPNINFNGYTISAGFVSAGNGYSGIKNTNLPIDGSTIVTNSSFISTAGFSGSCPIPLTTLTVVRGLITGCT